MRVPRWRDGFRQHTKFRERGHIKGKRKKDVTVTLLKDTGNAWTDHDRKETRGCMQGGE